MRKTAFALVFLLGLVLSAQALDSRDILALLNAGARDEVLIDAILKTGSKPMFSAQEVVLVDDDYRVDAELMYLCLQGEPLSRDHVINLARIDFDEDYFIKLIASPGINFKVETDDYMVYRNLDMDEDVQRAMMAAKPVGVEVVETPEKVNLNIIITGDDYQTGNGRTIYFYILYDGNVLREVVDDKIDTIIGSARYNKFIFTSYTEMVDPGSHNVAVALVPSDRGKPSQSEINANILFSKRIELREGFNQLNLQSRLIPGTESYELFER
ncbi:MAG TPA: hypothetical protein VM054_03325 [bacterium]|nr:hypothetical protein [bacterium]